VAGLSLGVGAIGGDLLKSVLERRIGVAPGARWLPADQLDFVLGAPVLVASLVPPSWWDVGVVCAVSFVADVVVNHVAQAIGIRETAW
jgi:CDP-2,3-bis-(O-geranylgeranyl)-sn-glycerol synthase